MNQEPNPKDKSRQYVETTAELMGLELTSEYLPGVVDNFQRLTQIAALVNEFELPENIEIAPTFEP